MKITRIFTNAITEDFIRNFFDRDEWIGKDEVTEEEFSKLEDYISDMGYTSHKLIYEDDTKEQITKIWEEERIKAQKFLKEDEKNYKESIEEELREALAKVEYLRSKLEEMGA